MILLGQQTGLADPGHECPIQQAIISASFSRGDRVAVICTHNQSAVINVPFHGQSSVPNFTGSQSSVPNSTGSQQVISAQFHG